MNNLDDNHGGDKNRCGPIKSSHTSHNQDIDPPQQDALAASSLELYVTAHLLDL